MFYIRAYNEGDESAIQVIWNQVIDEGNAFFWTKHFSIDTIKEIIIKQDVTYCAIDRDTGEVAGFYILHKNFPDRGSHIANALYVVRSGYRKKGIGKMLGSHSIDISQQYGYRAIQFNSIISTNFASIRLWESLGFERVGTINKAFMTNEDQFVDLHIYFRNL